MGVRVRGFRGARASMHCCDGLPSPFDGTLLLSLWRFSEGGERPV